MKIKIIRGYNRLLEYFQMKSLHYKSCYAITFTFNHAPCNLVMEKLLKLGFNTYQAPDTDSHDVNTSIGSTTIPTLSISPGHRRCCSSPYKNRPLPPYSTAELQSCSKPYGSGATLCTKCTVYTQARLHMWVWKAVCFGVCSCSVC